MRQRVRTANIDGLSIAFSDNEGSGPPIVFVHGSGFSMDAFARQFESPLLRDHRLIALDLPGHGASDDAVNADAVYSLRGYAASWGRSSKGWASARHGRRLVDRRPRRHRADGDQRRHGRADDHRCPADRAGTVRHVRGFCTHWDLLLASKEHFTEKDDLRFLSLRLGADKDEPAFSLALHRADGRVRSRFVRSILRGEGVDESRAVRSSAVPIAIVNGVDEPFARLSYVAGLAYGNLWLSAAISSMAPATHPSGRNPPSTTPCSATSSTMRPTTMPWRKTCGFVSLDDRPAALLVDQFRFDPCRSSPSFGDGELMGDDASAA